MSKIIVFCFFLLLAPLAAKETICLNMIVKNESAVICRCLDSVKSLIDYWVIVDTGSTDGTQEIIKAHLKDIPGELIERPWKNFGYNRTEALELGKGKGDFFLIIDADDWLEYEPDFALPALTFDVYQMWRGIPGYTYLIPQLVRANLNWKWVGVLHEYLDCPTSFTATILEKVKYVSGCDGARSHDKEKYLKHVQILEEGLKAEPDNERYVFYLAESYRDAGEKVKAIEWYQKRIAMGRWDEEVFWSKLQVGLLLNSLNVQRESVMDHFYRTHRFRPHRAEPVYFLAELYNQEGQYTMAYTTLKGWEGVKKQRDTLFNMDWIEDYGLLFQLSLAAYYEGHYQEALEACNTLLAKKTLPEDWRKHTETNRAFALEKLAQKS